MTEGHPSTYTCLMTTRKTIRLTDPQVSAIECRDWSEEPVMQAAWTGGNKLTVDLETAEQLWEELRDAVNAEDAVAEYDDDPETRMWARRACRSLDCVSDKVFKIAFKRS